MAALGKTPISLYYTPTSAAVPSSANLVLGELALNIADSNLYYLDATATTVLKFNPDTAKGIAAGLALQIPYQTAASATGFIAAPTISGTVLEYNGTGFSWVTPSGTTANALTVNSSGTGGASPQTFDGSVAVTISYNTVGAPSTTGTNASGTWGINVTGTAADLAGGVNGDLPYQTAAGTTSFLNIGTNNQVLTSNGSDPVWASYSALTIGTGLSGTSYVPSGATTIALANTAVTPGTYGTGISVPVITVDAQGRLTTVTTAPTNSPSYQGTWNATTNTPTIVSGVGFIGEYYVVSTAGTTNIDGFSDWQVGDWIIFDGTVWQQVNASNTSSFAAITVTGLTGYMYANATSQVTSSLTIPNTDITGLGTMSTQNANSVAITGGSITGVPISGGTLSGTTITATTQFTGPGTGLTGTATALSIGGTAALATAVAGGAANQLVYQTAAGVTSFIAAPTVSGTALEWNGTNFVWAAVSGTTTNALTFNTTGGAAAGTSFDGSAAYTIDYSTVGASPLAGSTSLVTLGTITTGTWQGSTIANTYLTGSGAITFGATSQALGSTVSALNAVSIGATTAAAGTFTALTANTSANISVTGALTIATSNATPGTMDNVTIGGTTPQAGYFTTLNAISGISGGVF